MPQQNRTAGRPRRGGEKSARAAKGPREQTERGLPDTSAIVDEALGSRLADYEQARRTPTEAPRPRTAAIGRAGAGPLKETGLGDDGSLGPYGDIDTSATGPAGVPSVGNLDPAGTGNAGETGLNTPDTALEKATQSSHATDVAMPAPGSRGTEPGPVQGQGKKGVGVKRS